MTRTWPHKISGCSQAWSLPHRPWERALCHPPRGHALHHLCRSVDGSREHAMSVGEKRSSAMGSSPVHIVQFIAMVSTSVHESVCVYRYMVLADVKLTMPAECTYDQPSNRRRNPAPQYIEAIENRLHKAEALLKTVLPDVDLDDPKLANAISPNLHLAAGARPRTQGGTSVRSAGTASTVTAGNAEVEKDSLLESMVQRTGSLDLDDRGHWDFHGHSSGLIFLRRMREQFGDSMGEVEGYGSTFLQNRPEARVFESPRSATDSPMGSNVPNVHDLPSKACGRELCRNALDDACALMRFVHQPTFYTMFDRVYDVPPDQYGNEEHRYLPLVYSVMALGSLFAKSENSKLEVEGYESATDRG